MKLHLLFGAALACSLGCGEDTVSPDPSLPTVEQETPAEDAVILPGDKADYAGANATPSQSSACDATRTLSMKTLDRGTQVEYVAAALEENIDETGALTARTFRTFGGDGQIIGERNEILNANGCLVIAHDTAWDLKGHKLALITEVGDADAAWALSPYAPKPINTLETWNYADDLMVKRSVDFGADGTFEILETTEYDHADRPVLTVCNALGDDMGCTFGEEGWSYDAEGRVLKHRYTHNDFETVVFSTFRGDVLEREETKSDGETTRLVVVEFNDADQPVKRTVTSTQGNSTLDFTYNADGSIQHDTREDFQGNDLTDRHTRETFDADGNRTLKEEDQPFNGAFDWRTESEWADGQKVFERATNLAESKLVREETWAYDGALLMEHTDLNGSNKFTYDTEGRETSVTRLQEGAVTYKLARRYTENGSPLMELLDATGDGDLNGAVLWIYDAAGNLVAHLTDDNGDFVAERATLLRY